MFVFQDATYKYSKTKVKHPFRIHKADINGKAININHLDVDFGAKKHLPKNMAKDIIAFAKTKGR